MEKKRILIISIFAIALLTVILSLIVFIISLPEKAKEIEKPKVEYGEFTVRYEDEYEPGSSTIIRGCAKVSTHPLLSNI